MKNRQVANNKLRLPSFDTARYFAQKVAYLIGFLCGPQRRLLPKLTFCAKATARYEKRYQYQTPKVRGPSSNGRWIGFLITAQIKKMPIWSETLTVCTAVRLFADSTRVVTAWFIKLVL